MRISWTSLGVSGCFLCGAVLCAAEPGAAPRQTAKPERRVGNRDPEISEEVQRLIHERAALRARERRAREQYRQLSGRSSYRPNVVPDRNFMGPNVSPWNRWVHPAPPGFRIPAGW